MGRPQDGPLGQDRYVAEHRSEGVLDAPEGWEDALLILEPPATDRD